MQYIYLALAVLTSGLSGFFYKKTSLASGNRQASIALPILWFLPLAAVFGIWALFSGGINCDNHILLPSVLSGIASAICAFSMLESMKSNSFTIAVIIVNLSFIFPVVLSILFLNESAHMLQIIGMALAIVVIVLLNVGKGDGKSSVSGIFLAVISSLCNGVIDFAIKIQQHYMPGEGESSFFFFTYLFSTALCAIIFVVARLSGKKAVIVKAERSGLKVNAPAIAVCNGVCFLAVSLLTGHMNAAAEFTVITSMSIIVSLAVGCIRLKEKLVRREVISLVFCAAAIICQYWNLI